VDHFEIVKRAWRITWRYRILWVFGLFAAAAGGGGGLRGYSGNNFNSLDAVRSWAVANLPFIILATAALFLIGIAFWIVSIAARGGLVYLVNEAAEERPVRARPGWAVGFHFWGRTFLISLLLALPIIAIAVVVGIFVAIAVVGASAGGAAAASGFLGICGAVAAALVILVPLGILIGILDQIGLRHGVLDDMPAVDAIKAAWWDVRHRFSGVAVMWVLLFAITLGYGVVIAIAAVALFVPALALAAFRAWAAAALLSLVAIAVLLLPSAIFNTLYSSAWTLFFRRLTGREAASTLPAHAAPAGYTPPPLPPAMPRTPAPESPAMPEPPAPETPSPAPPAGDQPAG
jgi:hypothetical protein